MLLLFVVAVFLSWMLARRVSFVRALGVRVASWLDAPRGAPLAVALATIVILTAGWGSWRQPPVAHDEASYLFQAKLFANAQWTADPPPLPAFFEQYHVFVTPRYASKYPPGHALLLVPGIWLGVPGLMPVLLSAIAAALIFAIARRLTNGVIAFWTWCWWIATPFVLWALGSYFSQSTSIFAWMLGWYALLRWRDGGERWLLLVAGCVAWLGFTRPLTALAYALPVGCCVMWRVAHTRRFASLGRAIALGAAMLLLIPLWSAKTVGTVRETPYALYSRMYFPWDAPGFGLDSSPPLRALPPDMQAFARERRADHVAYRPSALPRVLVRRARNVAKNMWPPPRLMVLGLAVVGLTAMTSEIAFGLASMLGLLLAYLWFDHPAGWVIYYIEPQPVFALLAALGLWRGLHALARAPARPSGPGAATPIVAGMSLCLTLFAAYFVTVAIAGVRDRDREAKRYERDFLLAIGELPARRAIVFVRYKPDHDPHLSLLYNEPDLENASRWIVYDRGAENWRLMRAAPDRQAFLFDEARDKFYPVPPAPDSLARQ